MAASLEETLISVWCQVPVEDAKVVTSHDEAFAVRRTSRSRLREVDFQFEGHELRDSNKILKRARGGPSWRDEERR